MKLKRRPSFRSDAVAQRIVAAADFKPTRFEIEPKSVAIRSSLP